MNVIYKYELEPGVTIVKLPVKGEILGVHSQHGGIYLWALIDSANDVEPRGFATIGTGHETHLPAKYKYIGTSHLASLVFHTFEIWSSQ